MLTNKKYVLSWLFINWKRSIKLVLKKKYEMPKGI